MQAGGFVALLGWDARSAEIRLMSGAYRMAKYDLRVSHSSHINEPTATAMDIAQRATMRPWIFVRGGRPAHSLKTVLSVDGGGLRGLLPATVLLYVERSIKTYLLENSSDCVETLLVYSVDIKDGVLQEKKCDEHFFR